MKVFTPLFQAVIAFVAVMTGLGFVFNLLLGPVKESQIQLKENQVRLEQEFNQFKTEVNAKFDKLFEILSKNK